VIYTPKASRKAHAVKPSLDSDECDITFPKAFVSVIPRLLLSIISGGNNATREQAIDLVLIIHLEQHE
jgi:hypothetical protein